MGIRAFSDMRDIKWFSKVSKVSQTETLVICKFNQLHN